MQFIAITSSDDMWKEVSQFAQNCSWGAGKSLAQNMADNAFTDWERVIVALHEKEIAGYCTATKKDCIKTDFLRNVLSAGTGISSGVSDK